MTMGVLALPIMLFAGASLDYATLHNAKSALQEAADSAALASARELVVVNSNDNTIETVAKNYALASIHLGIGKKEGLQTTKVSATILNDRKEVKVDIAYNWRPFIIQYLDSTALPIKVSSTASLAGEQQQSVCVLALDQNGYKALDMGRIATLTANDCVIFSNSKNASGISIFRGAKMSGAEIMSSGGFLGPETSYNPLPITDTPAVEDPLENRTPPVVGTCKKTTFTRVKKRTISPGTYCGGLYFGSNEEITLLPGDYIIKDGSFDVGANASIYGEDVGFYFVGNNAKFDFAPNTTINLSGRQSGPLAGMLFYQAPSTNFLTYTIRSRNAEKLEGAIYLPNGELYIDGKGSRVGQQSSWTALIAKKISIGQGPNIVINSDYASSSVPVPEGISGPKKAKLKQ